MSLRVILGEGSYAILGPGLSYSVYKTTNGMFTYYVPAHDPHESQARTEDVGGVARDRVDRKWGSYKWVKYTIHGQSVLAKTP